MTDPEDLRREAREAEGRGEYDRAVRLYLRAVSTAEEQDALVDAGLLVRAGDLERRREEPDAAVDHYDRAVDLYAEQGLLTNAVAVCNKILRAFPERPSYLARLAELHLDMGLTADARRHILGYEEAVDRPDDPSPVLRRLRTFLDREPDQEVAVRLAARLEERGRTGKALELLEEVGRSLTRDGLESAAVEAKARELDPDVDVAAWSRPALELHRGGEEASPPATGADGDPSRTSPPDLGEAGVLGELDGRRTGPPASGGDAADARGARAGPTVPGSGDGRGGRRGELDILRTLARLVEHRDFETEWHAERVGELSGRVAEKLGLTAHHADMIRNAAPLHDIGMVVVPDRVLLKEGPLTPEEHAIMATHAANGARILGDSDLPVLRLAGEIAHTHHERWDGDGYPRGLEGEEIPVSGRIVAVADAFEAMTHPRPHRSSASVEQALEEIRRVRGGHFDPRVVDALLDVCRELAAGEERATLLRRAR